MNGRVYQPNLGRMLSPDPVTQAPENAQNYNRYTYVFNNPLGYTDPSGYSGTGVSIKRVLDETMAELWPDISARAGGYGNGPQILASNGQTNNSPQSTPGDRIEKSSGDPKEESKPVEEEADDGGELTLGGDADCGVVFSCQATNTAGVGYQDGNKIGEYTCQNSDGVCIVTFSAVGGSDEVYGADDYRHHQGADGMFYESATAVSPFTINLDSYIINYFKYSEGFIEKLKAAKKEVEREKSF